MSPNNSCFCYKLFNYLVNKPCQNYHRRILMNYGLLSINSVLDKCIIPRYIGTSQLLLSEKKFQPIGKKGIVKSDGTAIKVKTKEVEKITLFDEKGASSVVTMTEARKLADKKGLILVEIPDDKEKHRERKEYKMETAADSIGFMRKEDGDQQKKSLFMIKSSIHDNDLNTKINIMLRKVNKEKGMVRIMIMNGDLSSYEKLYIKIWEKIKDTCQVKNKAIRGGDKLVFEIIDKTPEINSKEKVNRVVKMDKNDAKS